MKKIRLIALLGIFTALHVILSSFYIPLFDNSRIMFTFVITAITCLIVGPKYAIIYGFAYDTLGHLIHPFGAYFFGYPITAMVTCLIYSIGFYQKKLTITRIIITKTLVNLIAHIFLNSLWSYMLYSKGYLYYLGQSLIKNIILLPIEIIVLIVTFKLLLKIFNKHNFNLTKKIDLI